MKVAIGAVDAIAARTLQHASRCDAIWLSSFELACSLGVPDNDQLGFDELFSRVMAVTRAANKPLLLDLSNANHITARRLQQLLAAIPQPVTLVVDDTKYPRTNSFSSHPISVIPPSDMCRRLERIISCMKYHSSPSLCIRTEHYIINHDAVATVAYLGYLLANVSRQPDLVFIHGYNVISAQLDIFRESFPNLRLLTMSTVSPKAFVSDFESSGVDVLVIPNILTLQRYFEGPVLVNAILTRKRSVDGLYRPFNEVIDEIQFPDRAN